LPLRCSNCAVAKASSKKSRSPTVSRACALCQSCSPNRQRPEYALRPPGRPASASMPHSRQTCDPIRWRRHGRQRKGSPSSVVRQITHRRRGRTRRPLSRSPAASYPRPLISSSRGPHPPGYSVVDQPGQAMRLRALPPLIDRAGGDRPTRRQELCGLPLPLRQACKLQDHDKEMTAHEIPRMNRNLSGEHRSRPRRLVSRGSAPTGLAYRRTRRLKGASKDQHWSDSNV
jgi:hypothetical protein